MSTRLDRQLQSEHDRVDLAKLPDMTMTLIHGAIDGVANLPKPCYFHGVHEMADPESQANHTDCEALEERTGFITPRFPSAKQFSACTSFLTGRISANGPKGEWARKH